MKYFIVADVHGFYDEMIAALNDAHFDRDNPDHTFVSLGDLFDRGPKPAECLEFVMGLDPDRRILIRGNHEDLMEQAIARGSFLSHDISNGTKGTALTLTGAANSVDALIAMRTLPLYNEYIASTFDWAETDGAIFVHGWIPHYVELKGFQGTCYRHYYEENWRNASRDEWKAARWYNGIESWADGVREPNMTIFCGHWHTSWARCYIDDEYAEWTRNSEAFRPWVREGIVALDACTAWSHMVNCYVYEE